MKALARCFVWWPGLDADIEKRVRSCATCQENRSTPPKAPLHPWEWPHRPWARLHIDHAGPFMGHIFLILVDAYSKWMDAHIVSSTSAEATIKKLVDIFAIHGIPEQIISDNGTGFTSQEFEAFMKRHGIVHTRTSPYHPSSNGMAERAVQTFKQGIGKMEGNLENRIARFLFNYRITPQCTTGISPAELLMGRRLRCQLDLVHPDTAKKILQRQDKQITSNAKLRSFEVGDKVFVRNFPGTKKWVPGTIVKKTGPLSYHIKSTDGINFPRHVDHLRPRHSSDPRQSPESSRDDSDDWPSPTVADPLDGQPALPPGGGTLPPSNQNNYGESPTDPPLPRRSARIRRPVDRFTPCISN